MFVVIYKHQIIRFSQNEIVSFPAYKNLEESKNRKTLIEGLMELGIHELKLLGVKNRMKFQRRMVFSFGVESRIVVSKLVYVYWKRCSTVGPPGLCKIILLIMQKKIEPLDIFFLVFLFKCLFCDFSNKQFYILEI